MTHVPRTREKSYTHEVNSQDYYSYQLYNHPSYLYQYRWPGVPIQAYLHRCGDSTHPGPPYRCGGPFSTWHYSTSSFDLAGFDVCTGPPTYRYHYWGTFRPGTLTAAPTGWLSTWGDESSRGATGWNRYKPGKPGANLSVFIGELRDMPRMFQFKLRSFKDLGSQYLNYQFGWRPFLNDLRKFFDTTQQLSSRLEFFRRNNGRIMKRGGTFHTSTSSSSTKTNGQFFYPILPTNFYASPAENSWTTQYAEGVRVWFEGAFRFWIPDIGSPDWIPRVRRQMYGLNLSPSVVWELVPWSWLIDWFSNVGDVMSNLSSEESAENLVALYAYVMSHKTYSITKVQDSCVIYTDLSTGATRNYGGLTFTQTWEHKMRTPASPYGFGLTWDGFSPRQLAILAALGITRT